MSFPFTKCIGIELLSNLYNISLKILKQIENKHQKINEILQCTENYFFQQDILDFNFDYEKTSLIFMNCKTFSKDLLGRIMNKLTLMQSGVIIITTSVLNLFDFDPSWILIDKVRRLMSWGCANLNIYLKQ